MKERLEKLIREEKEERKEDADYFNRYRKFLQELYEQEEQRKKLGLSDAFEHAIFEGLLKLSKDKELSKKTTKKISEGIKGEIQLVGWKTKTSSEKQLGMTIYDILEGTKNRKLGENVDELTRQIINLAKNHYE
jgi:phosphoenolpyruvate-protein kinase (PTS system EI component)